MLSHFLLPILFSIAGALALKLAQNALVGISWLRGLAREADRARLLALESESRMEVSEGKLRLADAEVARLLEKVDGLRAVLASEIERREKLEETVASHSGVIEHQVRTRELADTKLEVARAEVARLRGGKPDTFTFTHYQCPKCGPSPVPHACPSTINSSFWICCPVCHASYDVAFPHTCVVTSNGSGS